MSLHNEIYQSPPMTHEQLDKLNEQVFLKTQQQNTELRKRVEVLVAALKEISRLCEDASRNDADARFDVALLVHQTRNALKEAGL